MELSQSTNPTADMVLSSVAFHNSRVFDALLREVYKITVIGAIERALVQMRVVIDFHQRRPIRVNLAHA